MKKDYEFWASNKTIKNLDLYTKLIGIFFASLGFNFLLVFLYWKFVYEHEFSGLILLLSVLMFMLTPVVMIDPKKQSRDLVAVVTYGIVHGACTISSIMVTRFWLLFIIYGFEILLIILLLKKNIKNKKTKKTGDGSKPLKK